MPEHHEPKPSPEDQDKIGELIEQLWEFLTSPDPEEGHEGPELVIELEPNDLKDDPRALELLQLLAAAGCDITAERTTPMDDIGSNVGLLHDGHALKEVTEEVEAVFGEELESQTEQAELARSRGEQRSKPIEEQIELRESFTRAVRELNSFMNDLGIYCAERIQEGCNWWDQQIPEPIRRVLEPAAAGASAGAMTSKPVLGAVIAVSVVALTSRRQKRGGGDG